MVPPGICQLQGARGRPPAAWVAWIFGQHKHVSAGDVTFAEANNAVECGVRIVRRSDRAMKRNAESFGRTKSQSDVM